MQIHSGKRSQQPRSKVPPKATADPIPSSYAIPSGYVWLHSKYRLHMHPKLAPTAFFLCGLSSHPNLALRSVDCFLIPTVKRRDIAWPGGLK